MQFRMATLQRLLLLFMMSLVNSKVTTPRTSTSSSSISPVNISDQFPNPRTDFLLCNRRKPSYICDPDRILNTGQADKLDRFANEHRQSTPCLCSRCSNKDGGVPVGVLIRYNLTSNASDMNALANQIRQRWALGKCSDDILIVVLAGTKKSGFSMGQTVQYPFSPKMATKIFQDCVGHFENENYYQGLESMVNSFRDFLQKFQKLKPLSAKTKKTGLIIGISVGVGLLVALILAAVLIRARQIRRRVAKGRPNFSKDYSSLENMSTKYTYDLYALPANKDGDDSSSSSDEGIDSDSEDGGHKNKQYNLVNLAVPPKFTDLRGRQLSDVIEEAQEDDEAVAIKYAMTNTPRNCHINVTEL